MHRRGPLRNAGRLRQLGPTLLLALLAGCAGDGDLRPSAPAPTQQAARLAATGNYSGAAADYLRLAAATAGSRAIDYRIQAAHYYARDRKLAQTEAVLNDIPSTALNPAQRASYAVLQAHIALLRGDPQRALDTVNRQRGIPPDSATWAWEVRADAAAAMGDSLGSLRARVELDSLLAAGTRRQDNRQALWQTLQGLTDPQLSSLQAPGGDPTLAGWASLALAYRNAPGDLGGLQQAIGQWQARHATHPAAKGFAQSLVKRGAELVQQPARVAVLLPGGDRYAAVAAAIRDGLVAAWFEQAPEARPSLRFFAVPDNPAQAAVSYRNALADGADLVIGPLRKPAVAAVAASAVPVPTLALNWVAEPPASATAGQTAVPHRFPPNLYQFGLVPEDDAASAAAQAARDGLHQAIALLPDDAKGRRIEQALAAAIRQHDGVLLETQFYNTGNESPFSEPIKRALNLDASQARHRRLENLLGENLEFEPHPRGDVDYVFLYASAANARQIIPQLAFFQTQQLAAFPTQLLPIYATAAAFDGNPGRDLRGLVFPVPPWQANSEPSLARIRLVLERYHGAQLAALDRFFALGIDAYRAAPQLRRLRSFGHESLAGASGRLRVDGQGRVHREPLWARVQDDRVDLYSLPATVPPAVIDGRATDAGSGAGTGADGVDGVGPAPRTAPLAPPEPIRTLDPSGDPTPTPDPTTRLDPTHDEGSNR